MKHKQSQQSLGRRAFLARGLACAAFMWIVLHPPTVCGAEETTKEYKVKASCLLHFALFVDWPAEAFADASAPLTIGVLGKDNFGAFIDHLAEGETIDGRPLLIQRSRSVRDLKTCHLLFISKSERTRLNGILPQLEGSSILTVGESNGFTRHGGIISFFPEGERIRFEINPDAAKRCGLRVSSRLLRLAKIVPTGGSNPDE